MLKRTEAFKAAQRANSSWNTSSALAAAAFSSYQEYPLSGIQQTASQISADFSAVIKCGT